jgi:hypothetical protein
MYRSVRACRSFILLALFTVHALAAPRPGDRYLSYSGIATARHSAEFLYGEHHVLLYRDGRLAERVVLYTCRDGSAFARKTVQTAITFRSGDVKPADDRLNSSVRQVPLAACK